MDSLGDRLRKVRVELGLTQPQLAEKSGIEQSYLSKLENNKSTPSPEALDSLLSGLSISLENFISGINTASLKRDLSHIPKINEYLKMKEDVKLGKAKIYWLLLSIMFALGITLAFSGYFSLIFNNSIYSYKSSGVIKDGEPSNIFTNYYRLLAAQALAKKISYEEQYIRSSEIQSRIDEMYITTNSYRGAAFNQQVDGGYRHFTFAGEREKLRTENKVIIALGIFMVAFSVTSIVRFRIW